MKKMKKINILFLVLVLIASVFMMSACSNGGGEAKDGGAKTDAKPVEIKFAAVGNDVHPYTIMGQKFKDAVEAKSNGQIKVTIFANGQLGGDREVVEGVRLGTIQMTAVSADGAIPAWVPELQILSLPYLFRDSQHAYNVLDGEVGQDLSELMEAQGIKNLGFCELGFRHFTNNKKEVKSVEDMKGLTLRVQEAKVWFALTDALGATASPMPLTEVYTALQQGVIDGQENPPGTIRAMKFNEVQKYLTLDGHTYAAGAVVITPKFFNDLTAEQQKWVEEAAKEAIADQRKEISARASEDIEYLKTEGKMVVTEPDKQSFVEATKNIPEVMKDVVPLELVEKVRATK